MSAERSRPGANRAANEQGGRPTLDAQPTATGPAPWEPSAWMRTRLAERVERAVRERAAAGGDVAVVIPLGRTGAPGSEQDRSCDRCSTFVPVGTELMMLVFAPEPWLRVVGGLCRGCWAKEVAR